jgi:hypothetical protein
VESRHPAIVTIYCVSGNELIENVTNSTADLQAKRQISGNGLLAPRQKIIYAESQNVMGI